MIDHVQITTGEVKTILSSDGKQKQPFIQHEVLIRIARLLMVQSDFLCTAGLMKGKMGLAIYFYKLGRTLHHTNYERFAGFLLQEVYENIKYYSSISFYSGLTGIGYALEYLFRNNYIKEYPESVMENIDELVLERNVERIKNTDLDKGIKGIAYYIIYRTANRDTRAIDDAYMINLIHVLKREGNDNECRELSEILLHILENRFIRNENSDIFKRIISQVKYDNEMIFDKDRPLGIWQNGYTSIGLKIIENETQL